MEIEGDLGIDLRERGSPAAFNAGNVTAQLGEGIAWASVIRLTPLQATAAPRGLTLSRASVFAWVLMLELLTILALPLVLSAFTGLADRGFIFAKTGGLLLVGRGAWMLASIRRPLRFGPSRW